MVEWYWQGKTEELGEKTCPSATLSITNSTWTDPGAKPGFRGERPATNDLSHGTAQVGRLRLKETAQFEVYSRNEQRKS
jgi:hypothetical protein